MSSKISFPKKGLTFYGIEKGDRVVISSRTFMSSDQGYFMYNSSVPQNLSEELLEMILQAEDLIYPWNPTEPEAEPYWQDIDETVSLFDDLPEDELSDRAEQFFSHLHRHWQTIDHETVEELLVAQFSSCLPPHWLESLLERAKSLVEQPMESLERLVACVQPLLSNWSEEDLQVFARPIALSMRGTPDVRAIAWEERSAIEKAKLTLAIAQEMLMKLEQIGSPPEIP
jgi:hypothetical protein